MVEMVATTTELEVQTECIDSLDWYSFNIDVTNPRRQWNRLMTHISSIVFIKGLALMKRNHMYTR